MIRQLRTLAASGLAMLAIGASVAAEASAEFTSKLYPATVAGVTTKDEFTLFSTPMYCANNQFVGTLIEESAELTLAAYFGNCSLGNFPTTVQFTSCDLRSTTTTEPGPALSIECADPTDAIDISMYANHSAHTADKPLCEFSIPEQTIQSGHTYTNNANGTMTLDGELPGLHVTQTRTSFVCPAGTETNSAVYNIQEGGLVLSGDNGAIEVH